MAITYTKQQIAEIDRLALINCNTNTIAEAVGIPFNSLKRRFGKRLRRGRALWRVNVRQSQANQRDNSPQMAIWLGKQDLGQTDKQVIQTEQVESKPKTGLELQAVKDAAAAYNARMSREPDKQCIVPITGTGGA